MFKQDQELVARAIEVLENERDAIHWLETRKRALGYEIPFVLANTEEGKQQVLDLLGRIEHGVFS